MEGESENQEEILDLDENKDFTFVTKVPQGATYTVTVSDEYNACNINGETTFWGTMMGENVDVECTGKDLISKINHRRSNRSVQIIFTCSYESLQPACRICISLSLSS